MYELHGWFGLAESAEETDLGGLDQAVEELRNRLDSMSISSVTASVDVWNDQYFLVITGNPNRKRGPEIDDLLRFVSRRLPGSYGLLYERDDEMRIPPGPNAFRVTVLARGNISVRLDPFLSPCVPVIED